MACGPDHYTNRRRGGWTNDQGSLYRGSPRPVGYLAQAPRYHPAAWVEKLSSVHKDQVFRQPHEHDHPDQQPVTAGTPAGPPAEDDEQMSVGTLALKWFFLLVALALTVSTLIGIWLGITQLRRWLLAWLLLAAGALIPLALLI